MKKSKFTDSQVMEAFKRDDTDLAMPKIYREMGISSATCHIWQGNFGRKDFGDFPHEGL